MPTINGEKHFMSSFNRGFVSLI